MIKRQELTDPNSCMSKAKDDEMTFVLIGRDITAPAVIRFWISERIRLRKNVPGDAQLIEAEECAKAMAADVTIWKNLGVIPESTQSPSVNYARYIKCLNGYSDEELEAIVSRLVDEAQQGDQLGVYRRICKEFLSRTEGLSIVALCESCGKKVTQEQFDADPAVMDGWDEGSDCLYCPACVQHPEGD